MAVPVEVVMLRDYKCCWRCPQVKEGQVLKGEIYGQEFHPEGVDYVIPCDQEFFEMVMPLNVELVNTTFVGFCRATEACL